MEGRRVFLGAEIAVRLAPVANGLSNTSDQLANTGFAFRRTQGPMQVLAGHDVGGSQGPVLRDLDVLLFENDVAMGIGDLGGAKLPLDFVVGGDAGGGE